MNDTAEADNTWYACTIDKLPYKCQIAEVNKTLLKC